MVAIGVGENEGVGVGETLGLMDVELVRDAVLV